MEYLSNRIHRMSESQTLAMAQMSRELQDQGIDIIKLTLGEPDFETPQHVKDAAKKAIDDNETYYTPVQGNPDLVEAIINKFKRENNIEYNKKEIIVSNGAKHTLMNIFLSIIGEDDEVLIPVPYWVTYKEIVNLAHGKQVFLEASFENNFKITIDQIKNAITNKTRAIIFNSPSNPSGSAYSKEELREIAELIAKYPRIMLISDEIYEHLNFNGEHESFAQFDFLRKQLILVNGVSKAYAMTGWRIGYMAAPEWVVKACKKLQGQTTSAPSSISQKASVAALNVQSDIYKERLEILRQRRDFVAKKLDEIPDVKYNMPNATFYIFPDFSAYFGKSNGDRKINNSMDLSMYLLEDFHVGLVAGQGFGVDTCLRLSFTEDISVLEKALERIKNGLSKLK